MYAPSHYRVDDPEKLVAFIKEFPFATFVLKETEFPIATHIPMEVVMEGDSLYLYGHISSMNPQAPFIGTMGIKALAVFSAGHTYVSSSWYSHPNVSTWNYRAVHVSGNLTELSPEEFRAHLYRMQNTYEQGQAQPALTENLPDGLFEKYLKAIRGFKIEVVKMEGAWKLSQNRNEKDYQNVISELEKSDDPGAKEVAREMKKKNHS
jgi:transcriptional regulator